MSHFCSVFLDFPSNWRGITNWGWVLLGREFCDAFASELENFQFPP